MLNAWYFFLAYILEDAETEDKIKKLPLATDVKKAMLILKQFLTREYRIWFLHFNLVIKSLNKHLYSRKGRLKYSKFKLLNIF